MTRSPPPNGPPRSDAERFSRLRDAVTVAAFNHAIRLDDFKTFYIASRIVSMTCLGIALNLIESSNVSAFWLCFLAFLVLSLDMVFNPTQRALQHCVRASKLGEVGSYMNDKSIPTDDAGLVSWWRAKAKSAGLIEHERI